MKKNLELLLKDDFIPKISVAFHLNTIFETLIKELEVKFSLQLYSKVGWQLDCLKSY